MIGTTYLLIGLAYLLGSFPSAYIAGRIFGGLDITKHGSGNVGGTNALRVLGVGPALMVAVVDISKSLVPTLWARSHFGANTWGVLLIALAAVLGHNYSVFLGFRGGKGIATTIGAAFALFPQTIGWLVLLAIAIVVITRYVSLASILLVTLLPVALLFRGATPPEIHFGIILAALGIWRHRSNISRLLAGTENRIGSRKPSH